MTVVVAAGNEGQDASRSSPSRVEEAIVVGAMDINDRVARFSNTGERVDVFAPGVKIISAGIGNDTDSQTLSGTSMSWSVCPPSPLGRNTPTYVYVLLLTPSPQPSRFRSRCHNPLPRRPHDPRPTRSSHQTARHRVHPRQTASGHHQHHRVQWRSRPATRPATPNDVTLSTPFFWLFSFPLSLSVL